MPRLDKLDAGLQAIVTSYHDVQQHGATNVGHIHPVVAAGSESVYVYLRYTPPLAPIEALGFETVSDDGKGYALGRVRLADLDKLSAYPGVIQLAGGTKGRPRLDLSIPDIRANQVWTVDTSTKTFSGNSGRGVIVGIIDTGLDFRHPAFCNPLTGESRVLRIWDQGLVPKDESESPDASLLDGGKTYGVEYTQEELTAELALGANSPMWGNVLHQDCGLHGTHVASTAAGNGSVGGFKYIGVAPEADIIAVKHLYLETPPKDGTGTAVLELQQFRDAVKYILNVAAGRPAVINMSFGSDTGPHDGLSDEEVFLTQQFGPNVAGRACVAAAGNDAGSFKHAHINVDAGGTVAVPLRLLDGRDKKTDEDYCEGRDNTVPLEAEFWYPRQAGVEAAVQVPGLAVTGFIAVGGETNSFFMGKKKFVLTHKAAPDVDVGNGPVQRNFINLTVTPEGNMHEPGNYIVTLKSAQALTIEGFGNDYGAQVLRFAVATDPGAVIPPPLQMQIVDEHECGSVGGSAGAIAVAAYSSEPTDPNDPFDGDQKLHDITEFSSRGDLVDYTGLAPTSHKPELAAPGFKIDAARSSGGCKYSFERFGLKPFGYTQMQGTSMASPHVAGAVALMLAAKSTLTVSQIRDLLRANVVPRPTDPDPEKDAELEREFGSGRLDVKATLDAVKALP